MSQLSNVLMYKDRVVFVKNKQAANFKRDLKVYQDDEACFLFIDNGEFSVRTSEGFYTFNRDQGLLAKCVNFFFELTREQQNIDESIDVVGIFLFPSIVEELFQFDISQSDHTVNYNVKEVQINGLMNSFKDSISILIDNPQLADESLIKAKLKEFILLISKTLNAPTKLDFLSAMFKKNDVEFKETIFNNLYSSMSIEEYANLCGMSVSTFKRKFKEVFNDSPKKYIAKKKIEKASKLLLAPDSRISDIAYDCGFETISTFNRSFKAYFGKSPSEYRLS